MLLTYISSIDGGEDTSVPFSQEVSCVPRHSVFWGQVARKLSWRREPSHQAGVECGKWRQSGHKDTAYAWVPLVSGSVIFTDNQTHSSTDWITTQTSLRHESLWPFVLWSRKTLWCSRVPWFHPLWRGNDKAWHWGSLGANDLDIKKGRLLVLGSFRPCWILLLSYGIWCIPYMPMAPSLLSY